MSQPQEIQRRPFKKIAIAPLVIGGILFLALVFCCNIWIIASTRSQIFYDVSSIPFNADGLVLGTGKLMEKGRVNQHFVRRIDAAAALYHGGKIKRVILSGDKGRDDAV